MFFNLTWRCNYFDPPPFLFEETGCVFFFLSLLFFPSSLSPSSRIVIIIMGAASSTEGPVPRKTHEKQVRELHDRFDRRKREIETTWCARYDELQSEYNYFRYAAGLGLMGLGVVYMVFAKSARGTGALTKEAANQLRLEAQRSKDMAKREAGRAVNEANKSFAKELIVVSDDLDRALGALSEDEASSDMHDGVLLTQKALEKAFSNHGLTKLNPLGEPFDPNFHESIFCVTEKEANNFENNHISEVETVGFLLHGTVLRAPRVIINKWDADEGQTD